ncbi:hypothetical protein [Bradyrhizobium sp.]|uniref:hypothetical protein n=1 Tax=Bradyrhizobium sp. TaxID=376 RepID=UPI002615EEE2|nr:hypothetical protein [Bradyrhizobium sp.]
MSTDFSIRPVGVPVAPSFPPAASNAALGGVPTQLPANQTVTASDAGAASRNDSQASAAVVSQQAYFDTSAASVVFQSVDELTGQVVEQYPDDAMLRGRAYLRSLGSSSGSTDHPLVTDVTA